MIYFLLAILGIGLMFLAVGFYDWFTSEVPSMITFFLGFVCLCYSICFPVFSYIDNCKTTYKVEKIVEFYRDTEIYYEIHLQEENGSSFYLGTKEDARVEIFENKDYVALSKNEMEFYFDSRKIKRHFEVSN